MKDNNEVKLVNIGILPQPEIKTIQVGNAEIQVKTAIPYEDLFDMIQWSINYIADDRPFVSEPIRRLVSDLAFIKYYTNVDTSFVGDDTIRMVDVYADYDMIKQSGLMQQVLDIVNKEQMKFYYEGLNKTLESITTYKNSAVGIMDNLVANANQDVDTMQKMMDVVSDTEDLGAVGNLIKFAQKI